MTDSRSGAGGAKTPSTAIQIIQAQNPFMAALFDEKSGVFKDIAITTKPLDEKHAVSENKKRDQLCKDAALSPNATEFTKEMKKYFEFKGAKSDAIYKTLYAHLKYHAITERISKPDSAEYNPKLVALLKSKEKQVIQYLESCSEGTIVSSITMLTRGIFIHPVLASTIANTKDSDPTFVYANRHLDSLDHGRDHIPDAHKDDLTKKNVELAMAGLGIITSSTEAKEQNKTVSTYFADLTLEKRFKHKLDEFEQKQSSHIKGAALLASIVDEDETFITVDIVKQRMHEQLLKSANPTTPAERIVSGMIPEPGAKHTLFSSKPKENKDASKKGRESKKLFDLPDDDSLPFGPISFRGDDDDEKEKKAAVAPTARLRTAPRTPAAQAQPVVAAEPAAPITPEPQAPQLNPSAGDAAMPSSNRNPDREKKESKRSAAPERAELELEAGPEEPSPAEQLERALIADAEKRAEAELARAERAAKNKVKAKQKTKRVDAVGELAAKKRAAEERAKVSAKLIAEHATSQTARPAAEPVAGAAQAPKTPSPTNPLELERMRTEHEGQRQAEAERAGAAARQAEPEAKTADELYAESPLLNEENVPDLTAEPAEELVEEKAPVDDAPPANDDQPEHEEIAETARAAAEEAEAKRAAGAAAKTADELYAESPLLNEENVPDLAKEPAPEELAEEEPAAAGDAEIAAEGAEVNAEAEREAKREADQAAAEEAEQVALAADDKKAADDKANAEQVAEEAERAEAEAAERAEAEEAKRAAEAAADEKKRANEDDKEQKQPDHPIDLYENEVPDPDAGNPDAEPTLSARLKSIDLLIDAYDEAKKADQPISPRMTTYLGRRLDQFEEGKRNVTKRAAFETEWKDELSPYEQMIGGRIKSLLKLQHELGLAQSTLAGIKDAQFEAAIVEVALDGKLQHLDGMGDAEPVITDEEKNAREAFNRITKVKQRKSELSNMIMSISTQITDLEKQQSLLRRINIAHSSTIVPGEEAKEVKAGEAKIWLRQKEKFEHHHGKDISPERKQDQPRVERYLADATKKLGTSEIALISDQVLATIKPSNYQDYKTQIKNALGKARVPVGTEAKFEGRTEGKKSSATIDLKEVEVAVLAHYSPDKKPENRSVMTAGLEPLSDGQNFEHAVSVYEVGKNIDRNQVLLSMLKSTGDYQDVLTIDERKLFAAVKDTSFWVGYTECPFTEKGMKAHLQAQEGKYPGLKFGTFSLTSGSIAEKLCNAWNEKALTHRYELSKDISDNFNRITSGKEKMVLFGEPGLKYDVKCYRAAWMEILKSDPDLQKEYAFVDSDRNKRDEKPESEDIARFKKAILRDFNEKFKKHGSEGTYKDRDSNTSRFTTIFYDKTQQQMLLHLRDEKYRKKKMGGTISALIDDGKSATTSIEAKVKEAGKARLAQAQPSHDQDGPPESKPVEKMRPASRTGILTSSQANRKVKTKESKSKRASFADEKPADKESKRVSFGDDEKPADSSKYRR